MLNGIEKTNAWDDRYGLPTVPMHNNPGYYVALALHCYREGNAWFAFNANYFKSPIEQLKVDSYFKILLNFNVFKLNCIYSDGTGFMRWHRWPEFSGGPISHDELIGWAYSDKSMARSLLNELNATDGLLDRKDERDNFYRFIFLKPFLQASAGFRVGLLSQVMYCIHLWSHVLKYKQGEESGTLKIWLMNGTMKNHGLCQLGVRLWNKAMHDRGNSPKLIFTKHYLTECPWFAENAPGTFS